MNYLALLEQNYKNDAGRHKEPFTKMDFLAMAVFDFTTYEYVLSRQLTKRAIEVACAISNKTTFEYQQVSHSRERWYLVMCNMLFFIPKLSWGSSIRGAWWEHGETFTIDAIFIYDEDNDPVHQLQLLTTEMPAFFAAVLEFAVEEMEQVTDLV